VGRPAQAQVADSVGVGVPALTAQLEQAQVAAQWAVAAVGEPMLAALPQVAEAVPVLTRK